MEPPSSHSISILDPTDSQELASRLRRSISAVLLAHGKEQGEVSVLLCSEAEITRLNREFRGVDSPTDVLTFPTSSAVLPCGSLLLGDIAICVEIARKQAEERGISIEDEISYLAIHGALHLCGYEDQTDDEFVAMQLTMAEFGLKLGLPAVPAWTTMNHERVNSA